MPAAESEPLSSLPSSDLPPGGAAGGNRGQPAPGQGPSRIDVAANRAQLNHVGKGLLIAARQEVRHAVGDDGFDFRGHKAQKHKGSSG